jgi:hypothetical protein
MFFQLVRSKISEKNPFSLLFLPNFDDGKEHHCLLWFFTISLTLQWDKDTQYVSNHVFKS